MERFTVDGIIVKTGVTGESDLVVWLLTRHRGVIRAFAKGVRSTKSRLHGCVSQFCYGSYTVFENKGVYTVSETVLTEPFFAVRTDLVRLTLAEYFCEVIIKCVAENTDSEEYLRLLLNSLHFLCGDKKTAEQIKVVFEMRFACISGYSPMLVGCDECGEFESAVMYFDCLNGKLYCDSCGRNRRLPSLSLSGVTVLRHIVYSKFEAVFSFAADKDTIRSISKLTQLYLQNSLQQRFKVLDYYTSVSDE